MPSSWCASLRTRGADVAQWLEKASTCSLSQWSLVVQADPSALHQVSRTAWDRCLPRSLPDVSETEARTTLAAWLATVGFAAQGSPELLVLTFGTLHSAASTTELNYDDWRLLASVLPRMDTWKHWDCCERLRRGLVSAWATAGWPPERFLAAVGDQLEAVLRSSRKVLHASEFLGELARATRTSATKLSKAEKRALKKATRD